MLCRLAVLVLTVLFSATSAQAEIRKLMGIGDGKLTPRFELILTPPKGWVEEKEASKANGVQMLVPRGKDFHSAPALMYVKVSYRRDKEQTVEQFIDNSQKRWRESVPTPRSKSSPTSSAPADAPPISPIATRTRVGRSSASRRFRSASTRTRTATISSLWSPSPARTRRRSIRQWRPTTPF